MSSHSASQLFDVFVEAKSALEELPKVKADLAESQALAQSYADDLTNRDTRISDLARQLEQLQAAHATKEAELARITFQHQTLRAAIGSINDTVRSVSDRPVSEPVAEPVPQPVAGEASSERGQSAADPTASQTQPLESQSANSAETLDTAKTENTDRPLAPENASSSAITSDANTASMAPNGSQAGTDSPTPSPMEDREGSGEAAVATTPKPTPQTENATSAPGTSSDPSAKPYLHWTSNRKPHAVTWGEYERLGGYRPHWCNPDLT